MTDPISLTVMRRVRRIHVLQPILSLPAFSVLVLIAALWGIGREVWVARIIANMPSVFDLSALARFFAYAFLHTDFIVQVAFVFAAAALIVMARESARILTQSLRLA